jgi:cysteinyl-tRNA synthetase
MIKKVNILINQDKIGKEDAEELISFIYSLDEVLAILPPREEKILASEIMKKIEEREKARAGKNYELADKIREELLKQGIVLEDTKDGIRWKIRKS